MNGGKLSSALFKKKLFHHWNNSEVRGDFDVTCGRLESLPNGQTH